MNYELVITRAIGAPALFHATEAQPFMAISVGEIIDLKGGAPQRVKEVHHSWYPSPTGSHVHLIIVIV
jgi:hypothetical protein